MLYAYLKIFCETICILVLPCSTLTVFLSLLLLSNGWHFQKEDSGLQELVYSYSGVVNMCSFFMGFTHMQHNIFE